MSIVSRFKHPSSFLSLLVLPLLVSCGGGYNPDPTGVPGNTGTPGTGGSGAKSGLQLSVPIPPTVSYPNDGKGLTQMVVQFSARDKVGNPLNSDEFDVELRVNDKPVDVESLLNQSSEELGVNLSFGMVLDASYSMTVGSSPAFVPMKTAARDSYQEVLELWKNRPGKIKFSVVWFDSLIKQSQSGVGGQGDWQPGDLLTIPTPQQDGGQTKLYSAVEVMAKRMKADYDNGIFNGPRDQYVMLVFSDGADNYSWFDNSKQPDQPLTTTSGASYRQFGTTGPASQKSDDALTQTLTAISSHPRLTTHVIGLGETINIDELKKIASTGRGVFQNGNLAGGSVGELFQRVMKEFTTLQTRGAQMPLSPGDYKISLIVTNKATKDAGQYHFSIRAGGPDAKVIAAPL